MLGVRSHNLDNLIGNDRNRLSAYASKRIGAATGRMNAAGTGQQHFFYQNGKKPIWLAAPRGGEEAFFKDALKVFG